MSVPLPQEMDSSLPHLPTRVDNSTDKRRRCFWCRDTVEKVLCRRERRASIFEIDRCQSVLI